MMFWGHLVSQVVVFRLPVLHCLHGIMTHNILSFRWQRMRLFCMDDKGTSMVTPWAFALGGFDKRFLTS